jgi:hypothetical protein
MPTADTNVATSTPTPHAIQPTKPVHIRICTRGNIVRHPTPHMSTRTPIRRPLAVKAAPRRRPDDEPSSTSTHRQCAIKLTGEGRRLALIARAARQYELDRIVDERTCNGGTQYLVHWRGYTEDERTWERPHTIQHTDVYKAHIAGARPPPVNSKAPLSTNSEKVSESVRSDDEECVIPAATPEPYVFVHPAMPARRMTLSNAEHKQEDCPRTIRYRPKCDRECQPEDDQVPFSQHNQYHDQHRRRRIIADTDESDGE